MQFQRCGNCANRCKKNYRGFSENCFVYLQTKTLQDEVTAAMMCRSYKKESHEEAAEIASSTCETTVYY